ncbi:hypothetical protein ACFOLC_14860 [Lysobacter cavernae]|uniref:Transposase DDE domain-containing protein n=1 Tax=Lysobacter cavernae TaxID=1685901 RepID=A0ABV7RVS6_9GAMM
MHLFKNECLRDTGYAGHDLVFRTPAFGPRFGRRAEARRAFALSTAGLHDDESSDVATHPVEWHDTYRSRPSAA